MILNNRHERPYFLMLCTHSGRKQRIKTTLPVKCYAHNWFSVIGNSDLPDFIENNGGDAKKASLHDTTNHKSTKKLHSVSSTSRKHDVTDDDNNKESTVNEETVLDILVSDLPNVIAKKTDEYFNQEFSVCRKEIKFLIACIRCVSNAIALRFWRTHIVSYLVYECCTHLINISDKNVDGFAIDTINPCFYQEIYIFLHKFFIKVILIRKHRWFILPWLI